MGKNYDFSGYATRNDLLCSDGRTIRRNAFRDNDGKTVPLVWNHQHNDPDNVLGHALLENREDGVYAYCEFNDTESGQQAKKLVQHGDVRSLSIYANKLKQVGKDVVHGTIRELSLVLAGANPGAYIDFIMAHEDGGTDGFEASYDENIMLICHAEVEENQEEKTVEEVRKDEVIEHAESEKEETLADVINTMTEKQKTAMYAVVGMALEGADEDDEDDEESEGGNEMKHNVFDQEETRQENVLSHSDMETILKNAKTKGSLRESFNDFIAHAESSGIEYSKEVPEYAAQTYGIAGADDWLFPDARLLNNPPAFIKRPTEWVSVVMHGTHHTPFSRIKSMFADITEDEARARGYIKGNLKKEEVFTLLKRTTTPTTIYKKQKMDRDDLIDITDFDVVMWLKSEMRMMLDEEIARAILIGDGRPGSSDDKINELNIRPIVSDDDLFTIKAKVKVSNNATADQKAKAFIRSVVKSRKDYRGSGNPTLFTTEDLLTDLLLMEDSTGRVIYDTMDKLKGVLRVSNIVTVPLMEGLKNADGNEVMGIIVNLKDYNVGADKGGAISMFEDFDIDYNQQKYLIETRCSGALIKPFSAIAVELEIGEATA